MIPTRRSAIASDMDWISAGPLQRGLDVAGDPAGRRGVAHPVRPDDEAPVGDDGACQCIVAGRTGQWQALAGDGRLVDIGVPGDHTTVHRDSFAEAHHHKLAAS